MTGLRTKLWFCFGGLLAILLVVSATSVVMLTRYSWTLEQLYRENFDSVQYCDQMKHALDGLNQQAMNLIWTGAAADHRDDDEARFGNGLQLELADTTLPHERERACELLADWKDYGRAWNRFESPAVDRAAFYRAELLPKFEHLKALTQQISDMNMENIMSVDGQVKQNLTEVRAAVLLLVLAGTVISATLVGGVGASVLHSVRSLTRSAREIEGGNLDLVVDVNSRDEIGQLAEAFNSMAGKLREFRKSDHERLLRTQLTTQLAIDSLPDAVFVVRPGGEIDISNRTAERHFGIAPGVTVGSLNLPWLTDLCSRVLADGHPFEPDGYRTAIQLFEDQQERFLLPRAVPMLSTEGKTLGITVILVDVTRLRHADEIKSGLVSTVSHELRTPLTSIRMGVLMLTEEKLGPLTPKQRRSLAAVRDDSDRLHRIIENLLSMGRIEAGGDRFQARRLMAAEIVGPAVEAVRGGFVEKNIELSVAIADGLPTIFADASCMDVALGNLLSNALKFTPTGGKVAVSVKAVDNALHFQVTDNGPGVPPENASRIFERFYRVPRKDGPAGAGLGLAICKEIVEAHGGRIEFHSTPQGSSFSFSIPVEASPITPSRGPFATPDDGSTRPATASLS